MPEKLHLYDIGTRVAHLKQLEDLWQEGLKILKTAAFRSPTAPFQIQKLEGALELLSEQIKETSMSEDAHDSNVEPIEEAPVPEEQEYIDLDTLKVGARLIIRTKNTSYTLEKTADGYEIWGHRIYCDTPTKVDIGSHVGRNGTLHFRTQKHPAWIVTSQIQSIVEI